MRAKKTEMRRRRKKMKKRRQSNEAVVNGFLLGGGGEGKGEGEGKRGKGRERETGKKGNGKGGGSKGWQRRAFFLAWTVFAQKRLSRKGRVYSKACISCRVLNVSDPQRGDGGIL